MILACSSYGFTQFCDLTQEEFASQYLTLKPTKPATEPTYTYNETVLEDIPDSWDWRQHGAVNAIKNQEHCGSCWAFSATANIEGQYAINHGSLVSLSEQQLVDCDTNNEGCNGGWMVSAFLFLENNEGQEPTNDYPYSGQSQNCTFNKTEAVAFVKDYLNTTLDEGVIAEATYMVGPLSAAVDATGWQFYVSGISNDSECTSSVNHGVNIIGYDSENGQDYWIIRNCWGTTWGEEGYMRLVRGQGRCGINEYCSSSLLYSY